MVICVYITIIQIIHTCLLFLGVLLHSLGIYLLSKIKVAINNQNIILMHLSVFGIISSSYLIVYNCNRLAGLGMDENFTVSAYLFGEGTYVIFYLIMILLTTDRLAMSLLLLKYQVIMTRKRMKIGLVLCWILGIVCGGLYAILRFRKIGISIHIFLDGCFLILTVATYASILCKVHERRKLLRTNPNSHNSSHSQFYLVTCLIISSFTLFVGIPDIYRLSIPKFDIKSFYSNLSRLAVSVNNIIDPCIYIFLQQSVRNILREKLVSWRKSKNKAK